jgi:predicted transcriptional regulator
LLCCTKRKNKTRLMHATNTSFSVLQTYSKILISRGLLGIENGTYVTKEKGFAFLSIFAGIQGLLNDSEA